MRLFAWSTPTYEAVSVLVELFPDQRFANFTCLCERSWIDYTYVEIPRTTVALAASTSGQLPVEQVMGVPGEAPSTDGQ
jgi:hypothetical protein